MYQYANAMMENMMIQYKIFAKTVSLHALYVILVNVINVVLIE